MQECLQLSREHFDAMTTKKHRGTSDYDAGDGYEGDSSEMVVMSSDCFGVNSRQRRMQHSSEPVPRVVESTTTRIPVADRVHA